MSPSLVPSPDHDLHFVLCDFGKNLRLLRALEKEALMESTIGADGQPRWRKTAKFTEEALETVLANWLSSQARWRKTVRTEGEAPGTIVKRTNGAKKQPTRGTNTLAGLTISSGQAMAKAGNRTSTERLLCEAKKFLADLLGSPSAAEEMLREALATGRVQWRCRLVRGGAADPDLWRSRWPGCCPAVNFEESKARALVGHSPSGVPIFGPWHLGITVSRADVRALLPDEPSGGARGYQANRVTRAFDRLEAEGLKLSDCTLAELRDLALEQIPARAGVGTPSRQTVNRVIRRRLAK